MNARSRWILAAALAGTGSSLVAGCSEPPRRPQSILLVTLDTFRADRLGCYGSTAGHTPNIDALAETGAVFEEAVAPMATTFPSHATMFTGLFPRQHDVLWNGGRLKDQWTTVAEVLKSAGYDTAAFVSYKAMLTRGGLNQGFDTVSDRVYSGKDREMRRSGDVTKLAVDWLRQKRERPFFAWVHYFDTHSPLVMTPYARQAMGSYEGFLIEGVSVEELYGNVEKIVASPAQRTALAALYDGQVREVDRAVGELIQTLRHTGAMGSTAVVITADHGQSLGEHDVIGHGPMLWDIALRVPLIIHTPDRSEARRPTERVGLIDLAPTLLELARVPVMKCMSGRSLVPSLGGAPLEPRMYLAEIQVQRREAEPPIAEVPAAVYEGRLKFLRRNGRADLFDVLDDRAELHPLPAELYAAERERYADACTSYFTDNAFAPSGTTDDVDPRVIEELKALGYVR